LIGYSLGASVALAEASQDPRVRGVVSWSGSLPDEYARAATALPPLLIIHGEKDTVIPIGDAVQLTRLCDLLKTWCEFQAFPGESHSFSASARVTANEFMWRFLESLPTL
jgi:dienelactone hydrolase